MIITTWRYMDKVVAYTDDGRSEYVLWCSQESTWENHVRAFRALETKCSGPKKTWRRWDGFQATYNTNGLTIIPLDPAGHLGVS